MNVENINNSSIYNVNSNKNATEESSAASKASSSDSIDISSEAKELAKQSQEEKLVEIKDKISSDYYSKKEVLEATAKAILKDIDA